MAVPQPSAANEAPPRGPFLDNPYQLSVASEYCTFNVDKDGTESSDTPTSEEPALNDETAEATTQEATEEDNDGIHPQRNVPQTETDLNYGSREHSVQKDGQPQKGSLSGSGFMSSGLMEQEQTHDSPPIGLSPAQSYRDLTVEESPAHPYW